MAIEDLRQSPMMGHMLDALDKGEDIGHYGRLVFAMIGRHFVSNNELVELLTKDHDTDEQEIKALVQQVEEKGYCPPRREKILEYQSQQEFPICPDPEDPDACNPYAELRFPTKSTRVFKSTGRSGLSVLAQHFSPAMAARHSGEVVR
jgi:hypothetical protein